MKHPLSLQVSPDILNVTGVTPGQEHVVEGGLVDGEESASCSVLRGHVGYSGPVWKAEIG